MCVVVPLVKKKSIAPIAIESMLKKAIAMVDSLPDFGIGGFVGAGEAVI